MNSAQERIGFIWSIAELLRGDYKEGEYGKVILPFTVLRRLDCVLASTKSAVLKRAAKLEGTKLEGNEAVLNKVSGLPFHNASPLDFERLKGDSVNLRGTLRAYIRGFSSRAREVLDRFGIEEQIVRLDEKNLLFQVYLRFAAIDLHPDQVSNLEMGHIFEELIRRFSEQSNETAGEHFTPREVIRLMVHLLFVHDRDFLTTPGRIRTLFDPACGTGGMLSVADDFVAENGAGARLEVFGQELNDESFAICCSDMMMKDYNPENVRFGNSFSNDGFSGRQFDYMLSNPPFGVDWKKVEDAIRKEQETAATPDASAPDCPASTTAAFSSCSTCCPR
jgi:type I restriction enzyme M protein